MLEQSQYEEMTAEEIKSFEEISSLIDSLPPNKTSEFYFDALSKNEEMQNMARNKELQISFGFDDHEGWGDIPDDQSEIIKAKVKEIIKEAARESNERNWGSVSAELRSEIMKMISDDIKWESLLKRFCGFTKRDERRSSIRKLNRKYPGVHPGYRKIYRPSIAVYVDESGSVSNQELQRFYGELDNLSSSTEFFLYKFDHSVDEESAFVWKKNKRPEVGRNLTGGTCFQSVTNHAIKNKKKFDAYIVLTDGGAAKPSHSLGIKRCWILAPNCNLAFKSDSNDIVINMK